MGQNLVDKSVLEDVLELLVGQLLGRLFLDGSHDVETANKVVCQQQLKDDL